MQPVELEVGEIDVTAGVGVQSGVGFSERGPILDKLAPADQGDARLGERVQVVDRWRDDERGPRVRGEEVLVLGQPAEEEHDIAVRQR